jgi:hypothetical protein
MEKRIIQKVNENIADFKAHIIQELKTDVSIEEIINMIQHYEPKQLERTDFIKRKRTKNSIPVEERCIAKSAKNDQCTRRRKDGCTCCGTHSKGVPHGLISSDEVKTHQKEVWAEDINGIIYYIDSENNVYKTEDIMKNTMNPTMIAKWSKTEDTYTIHWTF